MYLSVNPSVLRESVYYIIGRYAWPCAPSCCGIALVRVGSRRACGGAAALFRQYEYEEEMYLSLDGTATVYVNSSMAALNALRGTSFDTSPTRASIATPCAPSSPRR